MPDGYVEQGPDAALSSIVDFTQEQAVMFAAGFSSEMIAGLIRTLYTRNSDHEASLLLREDDLSEALKSPLVEARAAELSDNGRLNIGVTDTTVANSPVVIVPDPPAGYFLSRAGEAVIIQKITDTDVYTEFLHSVVDGFAGLPQYDFAVPSLAVIREAAHEQFGMDFQQNVTSALLHYDQYPDSQVQLSEVLVLGAAHSGASQNAVVSWFSELGIGEEITVYQSVSRLKDYGHIQTKPMDVDRGGRPPNQLLVADAYQDLGVQEHVRTMMEQRSNS